MCRACLDEPKIGRGPEPVIDAYKAGVDRTLLRQNLRLTPTQRIEALAELQRLAEEAHLAGRRLRHPA